MSFFKFSAIHEYFKTRLNCLPCFTWWKNEFEIQRGPKSTLSDKIIDKAKASISEEFAPISDVRASKKYRTMVAMNLLEKAMIEMKQKQMVETNVRN